MPKVLRNRPDERAGAPPQNAPVSHLHSLTGTASKTTSSSSATNGRSVLLVHGEFSTDVRIRRQLQALNTQTETCTSGSAALELAADERIVCVIVPPMLPDMSAPALIKSMHEAVPGMPVVVVFEHSDIAETVRVMQAGAHAVIESLSLSSGLTQYVAPLTRGR